MHQQPQQWLPPRDRRGSTKEPENSTSKVDSQPFRLNMSSYRRDLVSRATRNVVPVQPQPPASTAARWVHCKRPHHATGTELGLVRALPHPAAGLSSLPGVLVATLVAPGGMPVRHPVLELHLPQGARVCVLPQQMQQKFRLYRSGLAGFRVQCLCPERGKTGSVVRARRPRLPMTKEREPRLSARGGRGVCVFPTPR